MTARQANGAVSFNLNSLDLTGKKGIKVKLNSVKDGETEVVFSKGPVNAGGSKAGDAFG